MQFVPSFVLLSFYYWPFQQHDSNKRFANEINWEIFSYGRNVDDMINDLYAILNRFLNELFPLKHVTTRHKLVPWMNESIKDKMQKRKMFYDWWSINRKHQSADMIYGAYKKLNNEIKYEIRRENRNSLVEKFDAAKSPLEKWKLIHKYGVTRKAQKNALRSAHFDKRFTVDNLNEYFARLAPLPETNLKIVPVNGKKFDFRMRCCVSLVELKVVQLDRMVYHQNALNFWQSMYRDRFLLLLIRRLLRPIF